MIEDDLARYHPGVPFLQHLDGVMLAVVDAWQSNCDDRSYIC